MTPKIQKILCPVDFSDTSTRALEYALLLAGKLGAELVVLHAVVDIPLPTAFAGVPDLAVPPGITDKIEREQLAEFLERVKAGGITYRTEVVHGESAHVILKFAEQMRPDLIVMGSHGRTGLDHALFGSVAERVLRKGEWPVLIVRRPKKEG